MLHTCTTKLQYLAIADHEVMPLYNTRVASSDYIQTKDVDLRARIRRSQLPELPIFMIMAIFRIHSDSVWKKGACPLGNDLVCFSANQLCPEERSMGQGRREYEGLI